MATQNGTQGRVYGGDPALVHIPDGQRAALAQRWADELDEHMRGQSIQGRRVRARGLLCPGCYMVALYDAALALAAANGQDPRELGRTMAARFAELARTGDATPIEHIEVLRG